jgi:hypothetical protein
MTAQSIFFLEINDVHCTFEIEIFIGLPYNLKHYISHGG